MPKKLTITIFQLEILFIFSCLWVMPFTLSEARISRQSYTIFLLVLRRFWDNRHCWAPLKMQISISRSRWRSIHQFLGTWFEMILNGRFWSSKQLIWKYRSYQASFMCVNFKIPVKMSTNTLNFGHEFSDDLKTHFWTSKWFFFWKNECHQASSRN